MDTNQPEKETGQLDKKEEWAKHAAETVCRKTGIDFDTALPCARWAAIWMDDFKERFDEVNPGSQSHLKQVLIECRDSSLSKSQGVPRYPNGALTLTSIVASEEAFLSAFEPEEAKLLKELLAVKTSFD